jgi:hypothetical protein
VEVEEDHLLKEEDNLLEEEDSLQAEEDNPEEEVADHHSPVEEATLQVPLPHRQPQEHLLHIQGPSRECHQYTLWANEEL